MTHISRTDSSNTDFRHLVSLLDEHLRILDGDDHAFYAQFNKIDLLKNAVVYYIDDQPVSCGAFKEVEPGKVEIKRMYTLPEQRGKKIGEEILLALEKWAAELNYTEAILETGRKQPYAIRLYERAGYRQIDNFGQYKEDPNSICFAKMLAQ